MAQMSKIVAAEAIVQASDLAGFALGTRVMTADGEIPVEFLTAGDRIITREGMRVLRALTCTEASNITMIRVSSDSLGSGRPGEDVLLAPGQRVLLRDWRAKALFGQVQALVPIARLVDGQYISRCEVPAARLFALHFDTPQVIYAEGLELAATPLTVTA